MPVLDVLVLPPVVGEGTIGGRCVELDAVEISTVSCAVVAVPGVTVSKCPVFPVVRSLALFIRRIIAYDYLVYRAIYRDFSEKRS